MNLPDEDYRLKMEWDALPLVRYVRAILSGLRRLKQRVTRRRYGRRTAGM